MINLALTAALVYLADLFDVDERAAIAYRDSRIEPEFLLNKRKFLLKRKEFNGNRLHLSPNEKICVTPRSLTAGGEFALAGDSVQTKPDGSILVHPVTTGLTIAEISGLSFYGDFTVDIVAALENEKAAPVEVRAMLLHERVLDPRRLRRILDSGPGADHATVWVRMEAEDRIVLSLRAQGIGPCAILYIASRGAEGCVDYSWLHLRRIIVARCRKKL